MIKETVFLILLAWVTVTCSGIDRPDKPDRFLSEEEMIALMYDLSLVSASQISNRNTLAERGIEPDSFIYKKYDIDSAQLTQNIQYYATDFSSFIRMQEEVGNRLEAHHDSILALKERQDSIATAKRLKRRESPAQDTLVEQ